MGGKQADQCRVYQIQVLTEAFSVISVIKTCYSVAFKSRHAPKVADLTQTKLEVKLPSDACSTELGLAINSVPIMSPELAEASYGV